jgi:hypothetical protein
MCLSGRTMFGIRAGACVRSRRAERRSPCYAARTLMVRCCACDVRSVSRPLSGAPRRNQGNCSEKGRPFYTHRQSCSIAIGSNRDRAALSAEKRW